MRVASRNALGAALLLTFPSCASAPGEARRAADRGPDDAEVSQGDDASVALVASTEPASEAALSTAGDETPAPVVSSEPAESAHQLVSVGYVTWIYPRPEVREGSYLGYVRVGSAVRLRSASRVAGVGCSGGFYQVEPRGYVCADRTVSAEPDAGFLAAAQATRARSGPFPYRYAISNGAPMYNRLPSAAEQVRIERMYGPAGEHTPLPMFQRSHEELAVAEPIERDGELPAFFREGRSPRKPPFDLVNQTIPPGSMLSFSTAFEAEGRTWLLSADHTLVPADRVRPFRPSAFRGTPLGRGVELPIAWTRVRARPQYRLQGDDMVETGALFPVRSYVRLRGETVDVGGKRYLATLERDGETPLFIAEDDATVVELETERPAGVKEGQKWFLLRISQGTLVAYDGLRPVYATLMSPGSGGVSVRGQDNVKYSTTPRGTFPITFKDRAATMSPEKGKNRSFWIQDVPHTQYFNPPFAIHAAYWHERFGEYVSAGCVNLSPIDAEVLFDWSDPKVPAGWQGATGAGAPGNGPTTAVVIRR